MSSAQITFFVGKWEEKHVGSCRTTVMGLIGVTEYLMLFVISQFMGALFPSFRNLPWLQEIMILLFVWSGITGTLYCCLNVCRRMMVSGWKMRFSSLKALLPILTINYVFNYHIHPDYLSSFVPLLLLGFINAFLIIQMIVATMTRSAFAVRQFSAVIVPSIFFFLLPKRGWTEICLWGYLGFFLHLFGTYLISLVGDIAAYLGISVFHISPKSAEKAS